uniref:NADH dehydrogenase [ubiquinone] 1 beta subcomplex subunit 11, mitochondrial n=1 Tax=Aceria tosichella TaxID=561515 RepID=A0A6G1SAR7_9ACAR
MSICRAISQALTIVPTRAMATRPTAPTGTDLDKRDQKDESVQAKATERVHHDGVGYKPDKYGRDIYLNPLLTPPPRGPSSPEDFSNPSKLGHWYPIGFDFTDPVRDKYMWHELLFYFVTGGMIVTWLYSYGPDLKDREWARREAFLRTHKREALGLPLIDPNVVDPDRIVLPTEEEIGDYLVTQ